MSLTFYHLDKKIKQVKKLKVKLEQEKNLRFIAEHNFLLAERNYKISTEVIRNIIKKCEYSIDLQNIIIPEINHFLAADTNPVNVTQRMSCLDLIGISNPKLPKRDKK